MVMMADAFGADARLVAFMQYLRVIFVTLAAALIAGLFVDTAAAPRPREELVPGDRPAGFGAAIAIVVAGGLLGRLLRLPSPYFLGAVILGGIVHLGFGVPLQLPEWLLAVPTASSDGAIGLNFTRTILMPRGPRPAADRRLHPGADGVLRRAGLPASAASSASTR